MVCTGRGEPDGDHCCYVAGKPCRFLAAGSEGRAWECSLRRDLGSWEAVHADPGYQEHVQREWDKVGIPSCGTWQPGPNDCCNKER